MVVVAHAGVPGEQFQLAYSPAALIGHGIPAQFAIDLLFVTSGFILPYAHFGPGPRAGSATPCGGGRGG